MKTDKNMVSSTTKYIHPQKFAMWLFLVSVVMIFISLSSAYIVKKSISEWDYVVFPSYFQITSVIIIFSSVTMHYAYLATKKNNLNAIRRRLLLTAGLGLLFVIGQIKGWNQLVENGFYFAGGNASSSFVYVFSGLHILHLIGALIFLGIVLINTFKLEHYPKFLLRMEMCTTFWHFLTGLWLYLYLFLIFNN